MNQILEKHQKDLERFAHPHEENSEWKLVSLSTAKQRLELYSAELKQRLVEMTANLPKEVLITKDEPDITDSDFVPMSLPEQKLMVSIDDILKMINAL